MRVTIFTNAYKPTVSGVVTSIEMFRRGLLHTGNEVFVIAPDYKDYVDPEPFIFRFPSLDLSDQVEVSLTVPIKTLITPTVRGLKPSLIHSQHPILMGDIAANFAKEFRLPLVFTFHTRYDQYAHSYVPIAAELASLVTEELIRRYLKKCTHVIAPTPSVRDLIRRDFAPPGLPISVIPTPIDLENYKHTEPERIRQDLNMDGKDVLLYVGRLSEEKNLRFLLKAFAKITAERPNARLLLVGRGPKEDNLRSFARQLGVGDRVILKGVVPHTEIPHYTAAADLFVFPSETETQGLVVIESMAAGTPVVAVKATGSIDAFDDGGGVTVPADEASFAREVVGLLEDKDRRDRLSEEARLAASRYSIESAAEELLAVYRESIAVGPSSRG